MTAASARLGFFLLLFFFNGCAASSPDSPQAETATQVPPQSFNRSALSPSGRSSNSDLDQLARLWQVRSQDQKSADYPVGAGDVLQVSVPAIEELRDRTVRISGDGTISLPFIGKIQAAGLTEEELKQTLRERLTRYMYQPRIVLFVKEYRSRQVAVLGEVVTPGLYSLTSGSDTILDMISRAGGIKPGADPRIYLVPAESAKADQIKQVTASMPQSVLSRDAAPLILKRTDPIVIDTQELAFGGYQQYLSLAVRPGDLIMIPGGGQILVEGWVEKPGAYGMSPGLTVTGVVVAAGGALYPANVNAVKVIRTGRGGKKSFIVSDLEKIKRGETADITLQGGDIVEVSAENAKLIPYGIYRFFSTVVNVGIGGNVPMFR